MSQDETKKQEEATQDKQSTSTKATTASSPPEPEPKQQEPAPQEADTNTTGINNEELIIEQVRNELESYFAPQNIQNDFNLRQKMTTDGYIDIDLLLDLKLISDLVSNRDILIETISRSKLLVMNTGCTMVKYMPLLERNVLILRDIATSTKKAQVLSIFDNENCSQPSEIHSDIGNNWFCQFKTEEECLNTAKYLQQFGTFNGDKLHVRVKAIHDKNKADQSPQMQPSPPPPPPPQQQIPYAQGYYGPNVNPQYYYGQGPPPPPPPPIIDPYYAPPPHASPPKASPRARNNKRARTEDVVGDEHDVVEEVANIAANEEDRTAISDYPGVFDKYTQQEFLDIYKAMQSNDLSIPQSMRGRDSRIVSEETLKPDILIPKKEESGKKNDVKGKGNRKRRGRNKKEVQGTYYEEEVYGDGGDDAYGYGGYAEGSYYYGDGAYYDESYNSRNDEYYYNQTQSRSAKSPQSPRYRRGRRGRGRGRSGGGGRRRGGRGRGGYGSYGAYGSGGGGGGGSPDRKYRGSPSRKKRGNRANDSYYYDEKYESGQAQQGRGQSGYREKYRETYASPRGKHWSPRRAKEYSTNKGVYRTKTVSSAY